MVIIDSLNRIVEEGLMPPKDRGDLRVKVGLDVVRELRSGDARRSDPEDDFVSGNFRRTWRNGLPKGTERFGSDFDYFGAVVQDAFRYIQSWADFDPDPRGLAWYGAVDTAYASWGVWENRVQVSPGHTFRGPQVDIGPLVDYGVFIEQWNSGSLPNLGVKGWPNLEIIQRRGAVHALARVLQEDWKGTHRIYAMPVRPEQVAAAQRRYRKDKVNLFPIVRILPRHYK
jgi:hypothetical protein